VGDALSFLIVVAIMAIPLWRICARAGLNPAFSLFVALPFVGFLIVAAILAFSAWPATASTGKEA
jgi:hypothetical protein